MQRPPGQVQPLSSRMPAAVLKSCQAFAGQPPRDDMRQRGKKDSGFIASSSRTANSLLSNACMRPAPNELTSHI